MHGRCFLLALSLFLGRAESQGCLGGNTFNYGNEGNDCNCASASCTNDTCVTNMGGEWTTECPDCDPDDCDPLAASDIDDPSCTGAPVMMDRLGKKMYRRTLIASTKPQDSDEGVFCHLTFELCGDESFVTQGVDPGFGDYIRIAAVDPDYWETYEGPASNGKTYSGMNEAEGGRSYSPVNPLHDHTVQMIIKEVTDGDYEEHECTPGVDCKFGMSELACFAPVGTEFLLSAVPEHGGIEGHHKFAYKPNFSREPGSGPYTINVIGQGVALTELNILAISELLEPLASDGSFSTIKEINYLWANSYWSNAAWAFEESDSNDLARQFFQDLGQYGIRVNLMHAISREVRPEAEFPRTNVTVIGDAFKLTNTTDQDPNIKWFVVGSGTYKAAIWPDILEWGFDLQLCTSGPDDTWTSKGYPYCGPNALYEWEEKGFHGLDGRARSELFKYSAEQLEHEKSGSESSSSHDTADETTSSHDTASNGDCTSITDTVCAMEGVTVFCELLKNPTFGLEDESEEFTLFVPTDDAFAKIADKFETLSDAEAGRVILFHMYSGMLLTSDKLACSEIITSMNEMSDASRTKCKNDGKKYQNGNGNTKTGSMPEIDITDHMACNGVIHMLDDVMFPVLLSQLHADDTAEMSSPGDTDTSVEPSFKNSGRKFLR